MNRFDIHWLAGLLEGEGCFKSATTKTSITPQIVLNMTDRDVVVKAHSLMAWFWTKGKVRLRKPPDGKICKQAFGFSVAGIRAAGWMMTLYPLMGQRRQEKISEVLSRWRSRPARGHVLCVLQNRPYDQKEYARKWIARKRAGIRLLSARKQIRCL